MENTELSVKILLQKILAEIMEKIVLENEYKIVVPLFSAAYQFYNDLGLYYLC